MAYKLKPNIVRSIKGQTCFYHDIMREFGLTTIFSVRRWLKENRPNGPLTTTIAVEILAETLDLPIEMILETVNPSENDK